MLNEFRIYLDELDLVMALHLSTDCHSELAPRMWAIAGCQQIVQRKDLRQHLHAEQKPANTLLLSSWGITHVSLMCPYSCTYVPDAWTLLNLTWVGFAHYLVHNTIYYSKGIDSYRVMPPLFSTLTLAVKRTLHCVHMVTYQKQDPWNTT